MARYSVEDCKRVLREGNVDPANRIYFEAIVNGTLPEYYRGELRRLRFDYSDDCPSVDVRDRPTTQGERQIVYKCQGNYMVGLGLTLQAAIADGILDQPKVTREVEKLLGSNLQFQVGDRKNQERIKRINTVLDHGLDYLGRKKS